MPDGFFFNVHGQKGMTTRGLGGNSRHEQRTPPSPYPSGEPNVLVSVVDEGGDAPSPTWVRVRSVCVCMLLVGCGIGVGLWAAHQ